MAALSARGSSVKNIWNKYFTYTGEFTRKEFWKGVFWSLVFIIPVSIVVSLSAYAGPVAIIVFIPALIFNEWMFASLLAGRLKKLGADKKWAGVLIVFDLIPLVRIGYLLVFGLVNFIEEKSDGKH